MHDTVSSLITIQKELKQKIVDNVKWGFRFGLFHLGLVELLNFALLVRNLCQLSRSLVTKPFRLFTFVCVSARILACSSCSGTTAAAAGKGAGGCPGAGVAAGGESGGAAPK